MALRTVVSPKENAAENEVLTVQDAQTRIKEIIVRGAYSGWNNQRISAEIAKVIEQCAGSIRPQMQQSVRMSLAQNAQKWHFTYFENMATLNTQAIRDMQERVVAISGKSYNIDLGAILKQPINVQVATIDKFRPYVTGSSQGLAIIEDYEKRVRTQIELLASDSANLTRVDKNGDVYRVNLRNFAEMQVRYEANQGDIKRLKDDGVKLAWISSHMDASPRCSPWQGRLYSLDGTSGRTDDGIPYTPLDDATAGPRGDGNGIISGYNCSHRLIEYTPKSKAPVEYDQATIKRENEVTMRQRGYERYIRNRKLEERLERAKGNDAYATKLRNEWQSKTNEYKSFSLQNHHPFYEWRTRVTVDEKDQQTPAGIKMVNVDVKYRDQNGQLVTTTVQENRHEVALIVHDRMMKAKAEEPKLTEDIKAISAQVGVLNAGMQYRLKTEKSLNDKIQSDYARAKAMDPLSKDRISDFEKRVGDVNRYTAVLKNDTFVDEYQKYRSAMESRGYVFSKVTNTMKLENVPYKGINCKCLTLDGNIFEMQFHTAESYQQKESNHLLYEEMRNPETDPARVDELTKMMSESTNRLQIPPKIGTIK